MVKIIISSLTLTVVFIFSLGHVNANTLLVLNEIDYGDINTHNPNFLSDFKNDKVKIKIRINQKQPVLLDSNNMNKLKIKNGDAYQIIVIAKDHKTYHTAKLGYKKSTKNVAEPLIIKGTYLPSKLVQNGKIISTFYDSTGKDAYDATCYGEVPGYGGMKCDISGFAYNFNAGNSAGSLANTAFHGTIYIDSAYIKANLGKDVNKYYSNFQDYFFYMQMDIDKDGIERSYGNLGGFGFGYAHGFDGFFYKS